MTLSPMLHQFEGAAWLHGRSRAGLFDEMGVGKTATAIVALDMAGARRGIVVCPAAVKEVWRTEFKRFGSVPRRVLKGAKIDDLNLWLRGKCDVLVLSYEMAAKWADYITGDVFEFLIFDEAHYLKSTGSARTRTLLGKDCDGRAGLARWAAKVWFLTGTPMPNDPTDEWPLLRFCGGTAMGLAPYTHRYFRSKQGAYSAMQTPRPEMIEELRQVRASVSLRRTKAQAGINVPPIWLTTRNVDGDSREIAAMLREHEGLEQAILDAIEKGGLSFLDAQHIATLRRLVGEAKTPAFAALLNEELDSGLDKAVVFAIHKRAIELLEASLTKAGHACVRVDGSVAENARSAAVERFQNDPKCRVFIGNIKAAGTGLTLTAAAQIYMLESSWAPADNAQALMRVHRIGQTRQVHGSFVTLTDSIDERVNDVVARKTAAIAQVEGV